MSAVTLIPKGGDMVECRICGLIFVPGEAADREQHEHEHRKIICGAMPYRIRELLKDVGWAVAHNDDRIEGLMGKWTPEDGKRAVVFSWWARALSNGIPENDCERFMAAHFAFVDATTSGDEAQMQKAAAGIEPWNKYGG